MINYLKETISDKKKKSYVDIWKFFIVFIVYGVLSSILVFFTSFGWSRFLLPWVFLIYYAFLVIIILIVGIYNHKRYTISTFIISKRHLKLLFLTQILMYILMPGDCGDFSCHSPNVFIVRFMGLLLGTRLFEDNSVAIEIFTFIGLTGLFTYAIALIAFIFRGFLYKKRETKQPQGA